MKKWMLWVALLSLRPLAQAQPGRHLTIYSDPGGAEIRDQFGTLGVTNQPIVLRELHPQAELAVTLSKPGWKNHKAIIPLSVLELSDGYPVFRGRPQPLLLEPQSPLAYAQRYWAWLLAAGTVGLGVWLLQRQQNRKLVKTWEEYVAPEILDEMLQDPHKWAQTLKTPRDVTVLFSDINEFSTYSEKEAPETVATWLDQHYREMSRVIAAHQGTIIRFVGDQFMVLFGAPRPLPHPEQAAVAAALAMHRRLAELAKLGKPGFFRIKVGVHCGSMLLAVLGDRLKRDYTAIGDEANVAARIQDLCKLADEGTLVSQEIYDRMKGLNTHDFVDKGQWTVKGRHQEIRVYAPREKQVTP